MTDFLKPYETYITDTYFRKQPGFGEHYGRLLFTRRFFRHHDRNLAEMFSLVSETHGITPVILFDFSAIRRIIFRMVFWKFDKKPGKHPLSAHKTAVGTFYVKYRKGVQDNPCGTRFNENGCWNNSVFLLGEYSKGRNQFFSKEFLDRFVEKLSGATLGDPGMNPVMTFPAAKTPTEMLMKLKLNGTGLA